MSSNEEKVGHSSPSGNTVSVSPHYAWAQESSLTPPYERNSDKSYMKNLVTSASIPPLSSEEVQNAMPKLYDTSHTDKMPPSGSPNFTAVDRRYADDAIPLQTFGLISFVPSKGATPDSKGIYGFAKIRGVFSSNEEAVQRTAHIIKNTDSYHIIQQCYVGRPFPLTLDPRYSAEKSEIDIRKDATETISESVKKRREEDKKNVEDIQQREKNLLEDVKHEESKDDRYTTLRVKKAQLVWTYEESRKKMEEMKKNIIKAREEIVALEAENPVYRQEYLERYMKARRDAGIKETGEELENSFMKYMVEDIELDL